MEITEQDKKDIEETMMWLDKSCFYLMQLKVDIDDGKWLENVEQATDCAETWLSRIIDTQESEVKNESEV